MSIHSGRRVAIVGIGYSDIFRGQGAPIETLTVDACQASIRDAGITASDIDGIFEYQFGDDSPPALWLQRVLGTGNLSSYGDIMGTGPSGFTAALSAVTAVASGACETALAYRSIQQMMAKSGSFADTEVNPPGSTPFHEELTRPYGMFGVIPSIALRMQRRQEVLGGRPEDYGMIAINARRWAVLNDRAVQRTPLTMDQYLEAKLLCDPLRLLDCDYPVSGCCALIVTTEERARDLPHSTILVDAHSMGTGDGDWLFGPKFMEGGLPDCAQRMWSRSSVSVDDIDIAGLYDGFTYITLSWIEALGFCGPGEAGAWLEGGKTIGPGGKMPLNTTGGQLAEGRLHGLSFLAEIVLQLRGEAGARQVPGARAGVVGISHGPQVGSMVLLRD